MLSRMVLRQAGLKPDEVTFVPIASADVPPLLAGAIDTAILQFWELEPNQLFLVVVAQERKLAAEPAKFQALARALARTNRFMYANRARTVDIAVKHAKIDGARTRVRIPLGHHRSCSLRSRDTYYAGPPSLGRHDRRRTAG